MISDVVLYIGNSEDEAIKFAQNEAYLFMIADPDWECPRTKEEIIEQKKDCIWSEDPNFITFIDPCGGNDCENIFVVLKVPIGTNPVVAIS